MKDLRISFIIPAYNEMLYLERCVSSIVSEISNRNDYEIIIVDDGSIDGTADVIRSLCDKFGMIVSLRQRNEGLSAARNKGLDHAKGRYIFFVDADDYLEPHSVERLMLLALEKDDDVILFDILKENGNHTQPISFHLPKVNISIVTDVYINTYTILSAAWQGLFKREVIEKHTIRMPIGRLSEDDDWVIRFFSHAKSVFYSEGLVYHYCMRSNSITNERNPIQHIRLIEDRIVVFESLVDYVASYSGKLRTGLDRKINFIALDIIRLMIRKQISREKVIYYLSKLTKTGYYPLRGEKYSYVFRLMRFLLRDPSWVCFFAKINFFARFF